MTAKPKRVFPVHPTPCSLQKVDAQQLELLNRPVKTWVAHGMMAFRSHLMEISVTYVG